MSASVGADLATVMTAVAHQLHELAPDELRRLLAGQAELRYVPNELATALEQLRRLPVAQAEALVQQFTATPPSSSGSASASGSASTSAKAPRPARTVKTVKPVPAGSLPAGSVPASSAPADTTPATVSGTDPEAVRATLATFGSEAEATAYLTGLGLTVAGMRGVATGLGLRVAGKTTVAAIAAEIVRVFVRGRLNTATIQRL